MEKKICLRCLLRDCGRSDIFKNIAEHIKKLSDSDKAVIFSVVREDRAKETLALLGRKFKTVRGGKGIAYTIPFKSVVGVAIYRFLCDNRMPMKEGN